MLFSLSRLDGDVLVWIQETFHHEFLTPIMEFITHLGEKGILWIVLSILLLIPKRTRKIGLLSTISIALSFLIDNVILKNVVARIRPYEVVEGVQLLIERQRDFSFPSGHTGTAFACTMVLFLMLPKKYGVPAIILAAVMGFTGMYLGVHYPSDVLAGALIGIGIAILTVKYGTSLFQKRQGVETP